MWCITSTPDGKHLLIVLPAEAVEGDSKRRTAPQLDVVLNWHEELKRLVPTR